jgi:glycosyltransferase involved in cell wall biosynthesis
MTLLSIITPCYNEEGGIAACYEAVREVMEGQVADCEYEHVFIDNCSQDRTVAILREIAARDPRVRVIVNARNFGPSRSSFHGTLQTRGDATVPVFADLQTPPSLIPEMVRLWREGAKLVIAVKRGSKEGLLLRAGRAAYYRLIKSCRRSSRFRTSSAMVSMTVASSTCCARSRSRSPISVALSWKSASGAR